MSIVALKCFFSECLLFNFISFKKMQTYKGKKVTGFMEGSSLALEANFTHFHTFYCHFMLNYL